VGKGKQKTVVLKKKINETSAQIQKQAILPNIIHSLDAAHLILILNEVLKPFNTTSPVISIHDCFGTLPNNMSGLESLVKKEFINLYSNSDFLEKFNSDLLCILEKYKVYHEVNTEENKVNIIIEKSINSNLPFIASQLKKNKFEKISF
jgi:DNA-directed RNA polymerase